MTVEKLKSFTAAIEAQHDDARNVKGSINTLRQRHDAIIKEGEELGLKARAIQAMLPKLPRWTTEDAEAVTAAEDAAVQNSGMGSGAP